MGYGSLSPKSGLRMPPETSSTCWDDELQLIILYMRNDNGTNIPEHREDLMPSSRGDREHAKFDREQSTRSPGGSK